MRARASIHSRPTPTGTAHHLCSDPPLTLRHTGRRGGPGVHLVGSAAGPIAGDDLALDITVEPGARLELASAAASICLPAPATSTPEAMATASTMAVHAVVAGGGWLHWHPEPVILAAACRHDATTRLSLGTGARVVVAEVICLGRLGEPAGSGRFCTSAERDGRAVLRHELCFGPDHPAANGPTGVGDARAVGSVLVVGHGPVPDARQERDPSLAASLFAIDDDAWTATVLGPSPGAVRRAVDAVVDELRGARWGEPDQILGSALTDGFSTATTG